MNKLLLAMVVMSVLSIISACSDHNALNRAPGKYESTTSSTDSAGTTTERSTSEDVSVDDNGNKKAVVKTKTTRDPKGLFNKQTTEQSKTVEEDDNY